MRADLAALTPETLAELTNRGLVKRATREVDRAAPAITEDPDGTVHATFDDGISTALPSGGLEAGHCTCGATGVCRHVVALVLAYKRMPPPHVADSVISRPPGLMAFHQPESNQGPADSHPSRRPSDETGAPAAAEPDGQGRAAEPDGQRRAAEPDGQRRAAEPDGQRLADGSDGQGRFAGPDGRRLADGSDGQDRTDGARGRGLGDGPVGRGLAVESDGRGPADGLDSRGPGAVVGWSPGDFTDEQLTARIGTRMMASARRAERAGFVAKVHRARPGDPVPSVDLPTATVRFLVPGDLAFARSDAATGTGDDVIALAVWAFRAADAAPGHDDARPAGPDRAVTDVSGTGGTIVQVGGTAVIAESGLGRAVELAGLVLLEGAVHIGTGLAAEIAAVRRDLEGARLRWPLLVVEDLEAQLIAYRERSARYRPEALADHLAELHARHRAVTGRGASLRSRVLGTEEASETQMRRARLDGLGARVSVAGAERVVTIFLAHASSAAVLVLRRSWETDEDGPRLAARRIAGVTVSGLATGTVITESAVRSASRTVRLGMQRLSRTEVLTSTDSWPDLPRGLIADDLAALAIELDALPPRPVRARVEAEMVRAVPIAEVQSIRYAPGSQRLDAVIADAHGNTAMISATHAACAPGRLDSMAAALTGEPRFVAGAVSRRRGSLVIDPIGFATGGRVVVPDLAASATAADPGDHLPAAADPLSAALEEATGLLAEIAHRGLRHLPATVPGRLRSAATRLSTTGMHRAATDLTTLAGRLGPDPSEPAIQAWVDARLRTTLAADLR